MPEKRFIGKPRLAIGNTVYFEGKYDKLASCPHCGFGTDAPERQATGFKINKEDSLYVVSLMCTGCSKVFIAEYLYSSGQMAYVRCFPEISAVPVYERLSELSPRFVELHNQAVTAEQSSLIDLAGMGYRAALEVLIKDYAIKELKKPPEEVEKKDLAKAIAEYLNSKDMVKTADVVRLLGNDYAHFKKKFPEHDLAVLTKYYNIFMNLVSVALDIAYPPIERRDT